MYSGIISTTGSLFLGYMHVHIMLVLMTLHTFSFLFADCTIFQNQHYFQQNACLCNNPGPSAWFILGAKSSIRNFVADTNLGKHNNPRTFSTEELVAQEIVRGVCTLRMF